MSSATFPYSGFCHQVKSILVFASIFTCSISLLLHEQHKTTFRDDMNVTRGAQNKTKEKKSIMQQPSQRTDFSNFFKSTM